MKITIKTIFIHLILSGLTLFVVNSAATDNQSSSSVIEMRSRLINLIDSLDIEKQLRKRTGKQIEDIERQQTAYLDSLNYVRKTIQNSFSVSENRPEKNQRSNFLDSFSHPVTFFDWLIVVTSAIAILSCLILISGIMRAVSKKLKSNNQKQITSKPHYPVNHQAKDDFDKKAQSQPEVESLNLLRDKIKNDSVNYISSHKRPPTQILKTIPPLPQLAPADDLETQIYKAFQLGSDIHELSRKFQISTDHVSLILKMKGSSLKK